MSEALLSVRDCSFEYGEAEFRLQHVSVDALAGEMLGIVGPNGSGKSTLLRLMSTFLRPASGTVELHGRDIRSFDRRELAREMAFLPQTPSPSFEFTVREVVAMGRYPHQGVFGFMSRRDSEIVSRALVETDVAGLAGRYFSTLSGGEKQRVLIASVLAQQPRVMLLDEPTASLDIHHRSGVFDLLWSLSRKGMAVVIVTHELNAASQFCDRLVLLAEGKLVQAGDPASVVREELLSEVYRSRLRVIEHPVTSMPMVLVLGREAHGAR